jgi:hypothetical protein
LVGFHSLLCSLQTPVGLWTGDRDFGWYRLRSGCARSASASQHKHVAALLHPLWLSCLCCNHPSTQRRVAQIRWKRPFNCRHQKCQILQRLEPGKRKGESRSTSGPIGRRKRHLAEVVDRGWPGLRRSDQYRCMIQKAEIKPRTEYAFREKRVAGGPIERVRVLEHVRGNKWRTEWIEPNPGLVHYVESGQLLCPWKECKAFLKEEESRERLVKHNDEQGYSENSPIAHALYQVFESVGESEVSFYKGILRASPEALDRVRTRAGMKAGQTLRTRTPTGRESSSSHSTKRSNSRASSALLSLLRCSWASNRRSASGLRKLVRRAMSTWFRCLTSIALPGL